MAKSGQILDKALLQAEAMPDQEQLEEKRNGGRHRLQHPIPGLKTSFGDLRIEPSAQATSSARKEPP